VTSTRALLTVTVLGLLVPASVRGQQADPLGEAAPDAGLEGRADESFEAMGRPLDAEPQPALDDVMEDGDVSRPVNPDPDLGNENAPLETYQDDFRPLPVGRGELGRGLTTQRFDLPPGTAFQGQGIALTPWLRLRGIFRHSTFYDSNVNRAETDEEEDFEFSNSLGLSLAAARERWSSDMGYTITVRNFLNEGGLDGVDHRLSLGGAWTGRRLTLRLNVAGGYLTRPEDPELNRGQVERFVTEGRFSIGYQFNRLIGLMTEGTVNAQLFQDRGINDFDQLGWGGNAFLTINPNMPLSFQLGGGYRELLYLDDDTPNPDLALTRALFGAQLALPNFVSATVRVGYEISEIKERRQFPADEDPPEGFVLNGDVAWTVITGTRLSLQAARQITFSVTDSARTVTRVGGGVDQALPANVGLFARAAWEHQDRQVRVDIRSLRFTAGAGWTPYPWIQLGTQLDYEQRHARDGDYDVFRAGISLTFRL
jgi:hypothetical protein